MRSDTVSVSQPRGARMPQGFRGCGAVPVAQAVRRRRETTLS